MAAAVMAAAAKAAAKAAAEVSKGVNGRWARQNEQSDPLFSLSLLKSARSPLFGLWCRRMERRELSVQSDFFITDLCIAEKLTITNSRVLNSQKNSL